MLIHVALSAGEAFPDAVDLIVPRLPTLDRVESAIFLLGRSQAPDQHPQAVLKLLDRVTNRSQRFFKRDMVNLLRRVALVWPEAERDPRFRDLSDFAAA